MTSSGGAGCSRSHSFSGISSAAATGGAGAGADVFVRAADNEMYVRADKIDLKNLDVQFEKTRSKVWLEQHRSSSAASPLPLLEWEIDLAKLDIQNQVAHGTFGVVYRGTYDGHDVAGKKSNQINLQISRVDQLFSIHAITSIRLVDCHRDERACRALLAVRPYAAP